MSKKSGNYQGDHSRLAANDDEEWRKFEIFAAGEFFEATWKILRKSNRAFNRDYYEESEAYDIIAKALGGLRANIARNGIQAQTGRRTDNGYVFGVIKKKAKDHLETHPIPHEHFDGAGEDEGIEGRIEDAKALPPDNPSLDRDVIWIGIVRCIEGKIRLSLDACGLCIWESAKLEDFMAGNQISNRFLFDRCGSVCDWGNITNVTHRREKCFEIFRAFKMECMGRSV